MGVQSSLNLQLGVLPNVNGVSEELYAELIKLNNAVSQLAISVDNATNQDTLSDAEKQHEVDTNNLNKNLLSSASKLYLPFAETIPKDRCVYLTAAGVRVANSQAILGICSRDTNAGDVGEVIIRGLYQFSGYSFQVSKPYLCVGSGTLAVPFLINSSQRVDDSGGGSTRQYWHNFVGLAISSNIILVNPRMYWWGSP